MTDPERQPIAALLKKWRKREELYPSLMGGSALTELEAAIAAQVARLEKGYIEGYNVQSPTRRLAESIIADLQGKEGPEPNG